MQNTLTYEIKFSTLLISKFILFPSVFSLFRKTSATIVSNTILAIASLHHKASKFSYQYVRQELAQCI